MVKVDSLTSNNISFYRTLTHFKQYGEFLTLAEFQNYCDWARRNQVELYIVGNGSNTLFTPNVNSLVLKNKLPKTIKPLANHRLEISSTVMVAEVLKYCYENSLDSFYYLASVPATIGGALAMNAGRGRNYNASIYNFVESVTFYSGGKIQTVKTNEIKIAYRETIFTGIHSRLILSAVFQFVPQQFTCDPILERREWAKSHQDNVGPNCGSVFKASCPPVLKALQGVRLGKASYSSKTTNWILNRSSDSLAILTLIRIAKLLHWAIGKKAILEIIIVK